MAKMKRKHVSQSWHNFAKTVCKLLKRSGQACKPDSVQRKFLRTCTATIIPLAPASRPGSSNLPEGSSFTRLTPHEGSALFQMRSASRASSPLLFGLAPRGVCLASGIAAGAVGSYSTFSPLPALRSIGRCPEGFPPGYHRDTLHRRYILCGTFRDAALASLIPWRYQARRPYFAVAKWCPDFPPAQPACAGQASDHPAHPPSLL
jgi:hypothetical protein